MKADVIAFVAGVIATGSYFSVSSMLLIRTSSHTCGRWYLPMFLLRGGLLTVMNIDSFISLERFCSSLHSFMKQEYGQESIFPLWQWKKLEKKMADYRNHLRFTIKCLKMR